MNKSFEQIAHEALRLPILDRPELMDLLAKSIDEVELAAAKREVEEAWAKESHRRLNAIERGEVETIDAEEALRSARELLRSKKEDS